ncbi:MAG: ABC transporter ATP-binding protein [Phycisphaeraceae bacterium]|nr:ABC transporter ATP-binding protein [Phycisphaeraceae bacterium]
MATVLSQHDPRAVLRATGVVHRHERRSAPLGPINLDLIPGRITALVGPNGAGKTTLLRLLAGLLVPESGSITLAGKSLEALGECDRALRLALAPQRASLAFAYTVGEYVGFGAYAAGRNARHEAVAWAIEELDLSAHVETPIPRLSVGQQQRATIARALAQLGTGDLSGRVLLADEPASALDLRHALRLVETFQTLARRGAALLVAAHDLPWASLLADDVLALPGGGDPVLLPGSALCDPQRLAGVYGAGFEIFIGAQSGRQIALPSASSTRPVVD